VNVLCCTTSLLEPPLLLMHTLALLEPLLGSPFATSPNFSYVTSCPSNLGTGIRASVLLHLPHLTADNNPRLVSELAEPLGISVRGSNGEHTPIVGHMVEVSPRARLGVSSFEMMATLFGAIKSLTHAEDEVAQGSK
jgi:protein-arginine kinase